MRCFQENIVIATIFWSEIISVGQPTAGDFRGKYFHLSRHGNQSPHCERAPCFFDPWPCFFDPSLFFWPLATLFFLTPGRLVFLTPGNLVFLTPGLVFWTPGHIDAAPEFCFFDPWPCFFDLLNLVFLTPHLAFLTPFCPRSSWPVVKALSRWVSQLATDCF